MGVGDWVSRTGRRVRTSGMAGVEKSAQEFYSGLWRYFGWHVPRGTNVYDREWDTLVILDACRVDLLREVADEYPFLGGVESMESVGSMSGEWMQKTFTDAYADEMAQTAYVTANVFSDELLDERDFGTLDEVWRYAWDEARGTIPPRPVTDRAIDVARRENPDRLVVHYMQPHHPFIGEDAPLDGAFEADPFGRRGGDTVIDALRRGDVSYEAFWAAYRANLNLVLEDVSLLLSNHDAETVAITADHGDALGEWWIYDHPAGCLHPVVKNVPWTETTATDGGGYEPTTERESATDGTVEERLRDLGYV